MNVMKLSAIFLSAVMVLSMTACSDRNPLNPGASSSISSKPNTSSVPEPSESDISVVPEPNGSQSSTPVTMNVDYSQINAKDTKRYDWGPGGPKDDNGRPVSAVTYNKKFGEYNAVFVKEDSEKVYLTFDEGYDNGNTEPILNTLKEKNVKGLFFLTGGFVKAAPNLVKRMVDEGHMVGNHTWGHPTMPETGNEKCYESVEKLHTFILEEYGVEMKAFRFPAGAYNEQNLEMMRQMGYRSVFWSFAYKDWLVDAQPEPEAALKKILDSAHPGAIYLLHSVSKTNAQILGRVIDGLQEKGYTIGDPADLL